MAPATTWSSQERILRSVQPGWTRAHRWGRAAAAAAAAALSFDLARNRTHEKIFCARGHVCVGHKASLFVSMILFYYILHTLQYSARVFAFSRVTLYVSIVLLLWPCTPHRVCSRGEGRAQLSRCWLLLTEAAPALRRPVRSSLILS